MCKTKTLFLTVLMLASTSVFAQNKSRPEVCPAPQKAFQHAGPGSLWTLSDELQKAGWYIVQTPEAIDSKTIDFKDIVTYALTVYFSDSPYSAPFQVTCKYSIDADNLFLRSIYSYDAYDLATMANKYPEHYKAPDRFTTICDKGFAPGTATNDDYTCGWSAITE